MDENIPVSGNPADTGFSGERRSLSALFDDRAAAERAVEQLRGLGLAEPRVRLVGGGDAAEPQADKGFWESLSDFFFPDDDRATYSEGLRRGGYLLTVSNAPADMTDHVIDILDDEGAVDLEARSESWRSEGWTGAPASADPVYRPGGTAGMTGTGPAESADAGFAPGGTAGQTGYVPESHEDRLYENRPMDPRSEPAAAPAVGTDARPLPGAGIGRRDPTVARSRVQGHVLDRPDAPRASAVEVDDDRDPHRDPLRRGA